MLLLIFSYPSIFPLENHFSTLKIFRLICGIAVSIIVYSHYELMVDCASFIKKWMKKSHTHTHTHKTKMKSSKWNRCDTSKWIGWRAITILSTMRMSVRSNDNIMQNKNIELLCIGNCVYFFSLFCFCFLFFSSCFNHIFFQ